MTSQPLAQSPRSRRLPHAQHKAIVVSFLEGRSLDDIATFHALRRQTVESAIRDGLIHALSLVPEPTVTIGVTTTETP